MTEQSGVLVGGGALSIAGVLATVVAPLFADALGAAGLDNTGIGGYLTALHLAQVIVIFGLGGTGLIARVDRRWIGLGGCCLAAVALGAAAVSQSHGVLLLLMIVVGVGAGLAYAAGGSALSFANDTERAYALVTIASIVIGSLVLAGTGVIPVDHNQFGIFAGIAVVLVGLGIAGLRLPTLGPSPGSTPASVERRADRGWLGAPGLALVAGYFLLNVGVIAVWTFAGSIAQAAGMSSAQSWWFLGAAQVLSVVGCLIAWFMGARPSKTWVLVGSLLVLVIGKVMVGTALVVPYMVGILITNLTFYTAIPFVFAAGADLNPRSGRLVVIVGASAMAAGAVAPLVAGMLAGSDDAWMRLGVGAGVVILLSIPLLLFAVRTAYQRKYESGDAVGEAIQQ